MLDAARAAQSTVLHGIVVRRPDGGGVTINCRLFGVTRKSGARDSRRKRSRALIPEFGPADTDYLVPRYHGVSLFHDSELHSLLRSLGVQTVVLLGVS